MGRTGVTYQDVAEAASAIQAKGENPTVDRVREWLNTGSKGTITPLLKQWKHEQAPFLKDEPNTLPPDLLNMTHALWLGMKAKADEIVSTEKKCFTEHAERAEKNRLALTQRLQEMEVENTQLKHAIEKLEATNEALASSSQAQQQRLEYLNAQTTEQQHRIEHNAATIEKLNEQSKRAYDNLEHFRLAAHEQREQEHLAFDRQRTQWLQQEKENREQLAMQSRTIDDLKRQVNEGAIERKAYKADKARLEQTVASLTVSEQKSLDQLKSTESRLRGAQAHAAECEQKAKAADETIQRLNDNLVHLRSQLEQYQKLNDTLETIQGHLETQGLISPASVEKSHKGNLKRQVKKRESLKI
jgi:chromosome segregation ATPase